jgi:hypothetical protein
VPLDAKFIAVFELQEQNVVKIRASDPPETGTKKGELSKAVRVSVNAVVPKSAGCKSEEPESCRGD